MVVDAHRLDTTGLVGHLKGFEHALETVIGPLPQVGVDVLVGDGGVDLQVIAFGNAQGANRRQRGLCLGDGCVSTVDVHQTRFVRRLEGRFIGGCVTRPLEYFHRFACRYKLLANVFGRACRLALEVHFVARNIQGLLGFSVF